MSLKQVRELSGIYAQGFRVNFASWVQYRTALFIWTLIVVIEPLVYLVVWSAVSQGSGGSAGGYTTREFAAYYLALMLVEQLSFTWVSWETEYRIRQGFLSFVLLKPIHPVHGDIADNISAKLISLPMLLVIVVSLALFFKPSASLSLWSILAFIPAVILAFLVRFLMEWTLSLAAFWTTRIGAIHQVYYVLTIFLAGQIAPLELLPRWMQILAGILPFRWTLSFPVEVVLGRLPLLQVLEGFAAQAVWIALILVILRAAWRAGVRQYTAVGG